MFVDPNNNNQEYASPSDGVPPRTPTICFWAYTDNPGTAFSFRPSVTVEYTFYTKFTNVKDELVVAIE